MARLVVAALSEDTIAAPGCGQSHSGRISLRPFLALLALLTSAALMPRCIALAQGVSAESLAQHSTIIVRGKVLRMNASDEPMLPASGRTAIISVQQMYAGSEIAGDQKGQSLTVILSRPEAVRTGEEAFFFGNVRFLGNTMTIADEGEVSAQAADSSTVSALERGGQVPQDRAILDRLAAANLVFRGSVEDVRALDGGVEQNKRTPTPTEHDPEWHAASVRIITPLRGGQAGAVVTIAFAASRDITWFNSPKLKPGQEAVFLARSPNKQEEAMYRATGLGALLDKQPVYLVTEPYDVLQPADEARVRRLLSSGKE